jgi:hypothetical protein
MSELSPPLFVVRGIRTRGPDRAGATVHVIRHGSTGSHLLATYDFVVAKAGDAWLIHSISPDLSCENKPRSVPWVRMPPCPDAGQEPPGK